MTYLDYINYFWRKDREFFFKPEEVAIYFRLLDYANTIGWKEHFNLSLDRLMLEVGIKSRKPFDTARQRLREAGLLEFENGNGRGCTTKYTLLHPETIPKKGAKNTPLSATLSGEVSGKKTQGFRKEKVAVHKTKIKNKEANASSGGRENSASQSEPIPPISLPEPWAAWLAENAPRVQQLKSPLTAKQWAALVADFGKDLVQEVLGAMENNADLHKKYTSANLTARDWCKRRCPGGVPPRPAASASPATAPGRNEVFLAEQQRQQQAAQAARFDRYATQPEPALSA